MYSEALEKYNPRYSNFLIGKLPKSKDIRVVKYKNHFFCLELIEKILNFFNKNVEVSTIKIDATFLLFKLGSLCIILGEKKDKKDRVSIEEEFDWSEIFTEIKQLSSDMIL